MATQDTATKEQIVAVLQQQNITDLDSLAEFMIEKRASLKLSQADQEGGFKAQSAVPTFGGDWYVYKAY